MSITIKAVEKSFGAFKALNQVSLEVKTGELVALLGPSGCGKTTLLRIIAGLDFADSGSILMEGQDTTNYKPRDKSVGFVFQHYALFKHLNVYENVAFGLRVLKGKDKPTEEVIRERVTHLLGMVQMDWASKRRPNQLSGGQRQRVALARALAVGPKVLLLDEPFSALDAKVRLELRRWLRKLHDEIHVTSVFVTHDQEEALELADRVVILNEGRIEQVGTPEEVYDHPVNEFVYNFLGNVNHFHLRNSNQEEVKAFARPHDLGIHTQRQSKNDIEATITDTRIYGSAIGLGLVRTDNGETLEAELPREIYRSSGLEKGAKVFVELKKVKVFGVEDYQI